MRHWQPWGGGLLFMTVCAGLILAVGCRSPRRTEPLAGPLPLTSPELERGRVVFMQQCHACHPNGEGGLGPSINEKPLPAFLLRTQVRRGLGVMPRFTAEQISDQDLEALVAYLKAVRHHPPQADAAR